MKYQPKVVVVAEDEPMIRWIAAVALEEAGFSVIRAEHAEAALSVLQAQAAGIHVLFTDINMPGKMDGLGLAHHTHRHWPWIGLLMASGHPSPAAEHMPPSSRFLPKPYELDNVVRHALALAEKS